MAHRLVINSITPKSVDWICKVQVVDKCPPRDNNARTGKYQLLLLQDEEETQVHATIWNTDIIRFGNQFKPFQTYLVSAARVKDSTYGHATPFNRFTWTIDKTAIVEPIDKVIPAENPLPPPTRLTPTPFSAFDQQAKDSEFDVLALLINAAPPTYAANGMRIQEFIIMDAQKTPKKLTLWEEFVALYGNTLTEKLNQYPVILAKRVAKSSAGLSNRYNTSILIHPTYPQATTLHEWAQSIQPFLIEYTAKSTSKTGSLLILFEEESTFISDIQMQPSGQIFCIDGQFTLTNQDQYFYSMACSDCKTPFTRSFSSRPIYCIDCDRSTMLIPRLQFDITITDHTDSAIAFVSDEIAEKMLDLSIKKVYDICQAKNNRCFLNNCTPISEQKLTKSK